MREVVFVLLCPRARLMPNRGTFWLLAMLAVGRPAAAGAGYLEIEKSLLHLGKLHHLIKVYFYHD